MRILIVEDDPLLADGLTRGLAQLGFATDCFGDGSRADAALQQVPYDAVVLDLGLPGRDGLYWLQRWRSQANTLPVLILTARDGLDARIAGLDGGADDYLIKPVALPELAARLRAMIRRSSGRVEPVWQHGPLQFYPQARRAQWAGQPLDLSPRELGLLEVFLSHPGQVLSRQTLQDKLYSWAQDLESNALEVYVHHLRRKTHPHLIRTVRGLGYVLGDAAQLGSST